MGIGNVLVPLTKSSSASNDAFLIEPHRHMSLFSQVLLLAKPPMWGAWGLPFDGHSKIPEVAFRRRQPCTELNAAPDSKNAGGLSNHQELSMRPIGTGLNLFLRVVNQIFIDDRGCTGRFSGLPICRHTAIHINLSGPSISMRHPPPSSPDNVCTHACHPAISGEARNTTIWNPYCHLSLSADRVALPSPHSACCCKQA